MEHIPEHALGEKRNLPPALETFENIDVTHTFRLFHETPQGQELKGEAYWLTLKEGNNTVEGKIFFPSEASQKKLVLFEPGLPGDSVKWMEEKYVAHLLEKGYTVLVLRHGGTRSDTERSQEFIHCPERMERADMSLAIGDEQVHDMESLSHEPAVALRSLEKGFEKIVLLGHSSGALFQFASLGEVSDDIHAKVSHIMSLSGFLGGPELTKGFTFEDYFAYCSRFLNMGDIAHNIEQARILTERARAASVSEQTNCTWMSSPYDPYFYLNGPVQLQQILQRGTVVVNEQLHEEFHDLSNLDPETLLLFMERNAPREKRTFKLK